MRIFSVRRPRLNLKWRTLLCITAVAVFVLLVLVLYNTAYRALRDESVHKRYATMEGDLTASVADNMRHAQNLTAMLSYSRESQQALYASHTLDRFQALQAARNAIYSMKYMDENILSILLYDRETDRKINQPDSYTDFEMSVIREHITSDAPIQPAVSPLYAMGDGEAVFLYMMPFTAAQGRTGSGQGKGVCAVLYDAASFAGVNRFIADSTHYCILRDEAGAQAVSLLPDGMPTRQVEPIQFLDVNGIPYICFTFSLEQVGWEANCFFPLDELLNDGSSFPRDAFLLTVFAAVAVIGAILINLLFVARNINVLSGEVQRVRETERQRQVHAAGLPEMQTLADQINHMLQRIEHANAVSAEAHQKAYEATLAKQNAQMAFYRSQIDPHFLFNTLECIRSMAQHCGAEPVEDMISATNRILRYSLHAPFLVTVKEELDNADAYMQVMNQRAMGRYTYRCEAAPQALERPMLSMLLQPLMENAIRHGARALRNRPFILTVEVRIDADTEDTVIRVMDNGCGIAPDQLALLNAVAPEEDGETPEHIGIRNIRRRLRAVSERCAMGFESREGEGTVVTITLPAELKTPGAEAEQAIYT